MSGTLGAHLCPRPNLSSDEGNLKSESLQLSGWVPSELIFPGSPRKQAKRKCKPPLLAEPSGSLTLEQPFSAEQNNILYIVALVLVQSAQSSIFVGSESPEEEGAPAEGLPPSDWPVGESRLVIDAGLSTLWVVPFEGT